jgi:hypothetical protein
MRPTATRQAQGGWMATVSPLHCPVGVAVRGRPWRPWGPRPAAAGVFARRQALAGVLTTVRTSRL